MTSQQLSALTLPARLGSRLSARKLTEASLSKDTTFVAIDASGAQAISPGAIDEIVLSLMESKVEKVIVANASERFHRIFQRQHDLRAGNAGSFLLIFQEISEEKLLRA